MNVILPWGSGGHQPGDVVDLPDDEAKALLRQGLATKPARQTASSSKTVARDEVTPEPSEMDTRDSDANDESEG